MELSELRRLGVDADRMRAFSLDGALLLFDRDTGLSVIAYRSRASFSG